MHLRPLAMCAAASLSTLTLIAASPAAATVRATDDDGTRSLATVLASDGDTFDRNGWDYDILTEAVGAVLTAKPDSPVGVLADGTTRLTAFLPNDRAFRILADDLTGTWYRSESALFAGLAEAVGVDTIETVLLYHVIAGATIDSRAATRADGANLATALTGASVTVDVLSKRLPIIRLVDADRNDVDPILNPFDLDINHGNRQIAHGVFFVLRPADL